MSMCSLIYGNNYGSTTTDRPTGRAATTRRSTAPPRRPHDLPGGRRHRRHRAASGPASAAAALSRRWRLRPVAAPNRRAAAHAVTGAEYRDANHGAADPDADNPRGDPHGGGYRSRGRHRGNQEHLAAGDRDFR